MEFYELNLSVFNEIFAFPPSMGLLHHHVPRQFNLNSFWCEIVETIGMILVILKARSLQKHVFE